MGAEWSVVYRSSVDKLRQSGSWEKYATNKGAIILKPGQARDIVRNLVNLPDNRKNLELKF